MKISEGWASGLSMILSDSARHGIEKTEFPESANMFRVRLFRKNDFILSDYHASYHDAKGKTASESKDRLSAIQNKILSILEKKPDYTASRLSALIEVCWRVTR